MIIMLWTPFAAELLLSLEVLTNVLEPSCGSGHLSKVFEKAGVKVTSYDLIDRGYGLRGIDFLKDVHSWNGDIVTNPPYKYVRQFIEHALEIVSVGRKVCIFAKTLLLESKGRKEMFKKYQPKKI